jgi:hypothetical protein
MESAVLDRWDRAQGFVAIRDTGVQRTSVIHVLILNDVSRTGLTARQGVKDHRHAYGRILREINAG